MPRRKHLLDHRSLEPRAYLADPYSFGRTLDPELVRPPGGDRVSRQVALVQNKLVCRLRAQPDPMRTASLKAKFGFSRSWWGDCARGEAWMGETVLAAAVGALLDTLPNPETDQEKDARPLRRRAR